MLNERAYDLQEALTIALREEVGDDPVDRPRLMALRDSFRKTLENAVSPDNTVTDMDYRAQLAAAFEAVYQRLYDASRVSR